ncbi:hypothetical protein [Bradyrhizobium ivorense]|uniref:hypothetical protein n=1 Tax=Bradyrhizobium ivorense TaxID=2511166 RepID=UPI00155B1D58|nr:hypothetical protein [Bradyrhizobium ivorense]
MQRSLVNMQGRCRTSASEVLHRFGLILEGIWRFTSGDAARDFMADMPVRTALRSS